MTDASRLETLRGNRSLRAIANKITMPTGAPASGQAVRNWELGANNPSTYRVLEQYAHALGDDYVDEVLAMFPELHPEGASELLVLVREVHRQLTHDGTGPPANGDLDPADSPDTVAKRLDRLEDQLGTLLLAMDRVVNLAVRRRSQGGSAKAEAL